MKPKYDIEVEPSDGNAFSILGAVSKALTRAGATPAETAEYRNAATSGDYNHLLRISMEWVDLVA